MKRMFFLAAVLILSASCVQKPKVVQEKARVVQEKETGEPDSVRIRKMNEELRSYMESMNNARMKFEKKDYNGAIAEYTKIIEESSFSSSSRRVIIFEGSYPFNIYIARGLAKDSLQDYKGAIDDYTMAIDKSTWLNPKLVQLFPLFVDRNIPPQGVVATEISPFELITIE